MVDVFDFGDFIGVEVEYVKFGESFEVFNLLNVVFTEH